MTDEVTRQLCDAQHVLLTHTCALDPGQVLRALAGPQQLPGEADRETASVTGTRNASQHTPNTWAKDARG